MKKPAHLPTPHDDVLAGARARVKGVEPTSVTRVRNVSGLMKARLPAHLVDLLKHAGTLAERDNISVFAVGGFVRDLLLGRRNFDVDLVVEGDGIAYARRLAQEWKAVAKIHERFGTAVVILPDGFKLDVATARTEYYEYPTALPTVERSSIKKDLFRRDFTINTLAVRLNAGRFGDLLDFYGAQRDLNEKTIRVLHGLSFVEDPTRVFRAIRFEQRFGFRLATETLALIKGTVQMELFHRLSGSRLLEELILLFSEEEPRKAILRLGELDLLRFIHPDLKRAHLQTILKSIEEALGWYHLLYLKRTLDGWLVYFMALMDQIPVQAVKEALTRLRVPERYAKKIRDARLGLADLLYRLRRRRNPRPADIYRMLSGIPDEALLYLMAKTKSDSIRRHLSAYVTTYRSVTPMMTGADLQRLGINPGPIYRKILNRLLEARLNGDATTEAEERALAMRLAKE